MRFNSGKIFTLVGSLLGVICFFLPWVHMETAAKVMPLLRPVIGLLHPYFGELLDSANRFSSLSGLELTFKVSYIPTSLRILASLPLVMAILASILLVLSVVRGRTAESLAMGMATVCILVLVFLVYSIPSIERLGYASNILVALSSELLGVKLSWGFWGSLVALILIAVGVVLDAANPTPDEYEYEYADQYM